MAMNDALASQSLNDCRGFHQLGLCDLSVPFFDGCSEHLQLGSHGGPKVSVPGALFAVLLDSLDCAFVVGHVWTPESLIF